MLKKIWICASKMIPANLSEPTGLLIVTTNQVEQIQTDKHLHVQGNHFEKIDGNMSLNVGGNQWKVSPATSPFR